MIKALVISSIGLNIGLFLGRLAGFAREAFVAASYGVSSSADIVVLMLTVPDLLVNILMGGAMGAMLIPAFASQPDRARQILYQASFVFGLLFTALTLLLIYFSPLLVRLLVPGFETGLVDYAASTLNMVLWLVPLTVLAGITTAYLHAVNRFFIASIGALIINCSIIAGLLLAKNSGFSLSVVAGFVILGGVLRWGSQLLLIPLRWNPVSALKQFLLTREMVLRYIQAMFSGSLLLLFPVVVRALASFEGDGSVALLNYSVRLVEFPLVISVTFLSVVLFPRLAQSYSEDPELHRQLVKYGAQICLVLSSTAALILIITSDAYAEFVFGHGFMQDSGVKSVAGLVSIGLLSLPFQGLSTLLTAIFNSRLDTRTPMLINGTGLLALLAGYQLRLYGQDLESLMWLLVSSYALICFMQLAFLRIGTLDWFEVFSIKGFLLPLALSLLVAALGSSWIVVAEMSAWISMALAGVIGILAIAVMALSSGDIRKRLQSLVSER